MRGGPGRSPAAASRTHGKVVRPRSCRPAATATTATTATTAHAASRRSTRASRCGSAHAGSQGRGRARLAANTVTRQRENLVMSPVHALRLHLLVLPGKRWLPLVAGLGTAGLLLLLTVMEFMLPGAFDAVGLAAMLRLPRDAVVWTSIAVAAGSGCCRLLALRRWAGRTRLSRRLPRRFSRRPPGVRRTDAAGHGFG